jgi:hypothetical protein
VPPLSVGAVQDKSTEVDVTAVDAKDCGALGAVIQLIVDLIRPFRIKLPFTKQPPPLVLRKTRVVDELSLRHPYQSGEAASRNKPGDSVRVWAVAV